MKGRTPPENTDGHRNDRKMRLLFLLIAPLAAYIIMVSAMVPSAYGISAYPPDRALPVPQFGFTLIVMLWGLFAGIALKETAWFRHWNQRAITTFLIVITGLLIITGPLFLTYQNVTQAPSARTFAAMWDERDMLVRSAVTQGESEVSLTSVGRIGDLPDIREEADHWINKCFAAYYGLDAAVSE